MQCVSQADCRHAYTAGSRGSLLHPRPDRPDAPREVVARSLVARGVSGPSEPVQRLGAGHYWDFDGRLGWHTGSGGATAFDVSDPPEPAARQRHRRAAAARAPYNDFILHNSHAPQRRRVPRRRHALASLNGNVLLVTEEDYANDGDEVLCDKAGTFQTWYVPDLDGSAYRRAQHRRRATPTSAPCRPLDITQRAERVRRWAHHARGRLLLGALVRRAPGRLRRAGLLRRGPAHPRRPRPAQHQADRLLHRRRHRGLGRLLGAAARQRPRRVPGRRPTSSTPPTPPAASTSTRVALPSRRRGRHRPRARAVLAAPALPAALGRAGATLGLSLLAAGRPAAASAWLRRRRTA